VADGVVVGIVDALVEGAPEPVVRSAEQAATVASPAPARRRSTSELSGRLSTGPVRRARGLSAVSPSLAT
jgi:hypothetical protein